MRMPPRASSMPQPWPKMSPPHTNDTVRRSDGAVRKRPTAGSLRIVGERMILETHAVEDVLARRQILDQRLGGEIAMRQRIDEHALAHVAEAFRGGNLDLHARRPVGARPDHAAIEPDIAGLHAMGDQRPVVGAADVGRATLSAAAEVETVRNFRRVRIWMRACAAFLATETL